MDSGARKLNAQRANSIVRLDRHGLSDLPRVLMRTMARLRWLPYTSILALLVLSGCSWLPWTKPQPSDEELIYQLLYSSPLRSSSAPGQSAEPSRSDKSISIAPVRPTGINQAPLTLSTIQSCLQSKDIPPETLQAANPTNYDRRLRLDANGRPVEGFPLIIVLHETVTSEQDTVNMFRTPHTDETTQASYHVLIPEDGRRVRIVGDENRAFGAGNSAFGDYTIRLKPDSPGSINNVALHLSFVSPPDGRGEAPTHSGYSPRQYRSAAAQVLLWQASYAIPLDRLTTHKQVDQSQTRTDPRSFDWSRFFSAHSQLARSCGLQAFAAAR